MESCWVLFRLSPRVGVLQFRVLKTTGPNVDSSDSLRTTFLLLTDSVKVPRPTKSLDNRPCGEGRTVGQLMKVEIEWTVVKNCLTGNRKIRCCYSWRGKEHYGRPRRGGKTKKCRSLFVSRDSLWWSFFVVSPFPTPFPRFPHPTISLRFRLQVERTEFWLHYKTHFRTKEPKTYRFLRLSQVIHLFQPFVLNLFDRGSLDRRTLRSVN